MCRTLFPALCISAVLGLSIPAVAEDLEVVKVALPAINCLANVDCRIVVDDTTSPLADGTMLGGEGFLQARSARTAADGPAAGRLMMLYRLDLRRAKGLADDACLNRFRLPTARPAAELDLDGDGTPDDGIFAITRGGLGSVTPSRARFENGYLDVGFDSGVCPWKGNEEGQSSVFFGFFARGEPAASAVRLATVGGMEIRALARAPAPAVRRVSYRVADELVAKTFTAPGLHANEEREVAALRDEAGHLHRFVADEIVLTTDDPDALQDFIERYDAKVLRSFDPANFGLDDPRIDYHLSLDTAVLEMDVDTLADDLIALGHLDGGSFAISSNDALELLVLVAHESRRGLALDVEWVAELRQFRGFATQEAANFPPLNVRRGVGIPDSFSYSRNAYDWPTHSSGSPQDIGVGDAWDMLARVGRLHPSQRLAVIDLGFGFTTDQPFASVDTLDNIDPLRTRFPNENYCSNPCAHGSKVASTFAAVPDNRVGAAGPAGPVASEIIYVAAALNTRTSLLGGLQIAFENHADVVNMSFGTEGWEVWAWNAGYTEGLSRYTRGLRDGGMILTAAAGNDGDEENAGVFGNFDFPCQNDGVICVGGVDFNSRLRHPNSDFGNGVEIFGPYVNFVGPLPTATDDTTINLFTGTSGASPFVAGVAALVRAADPSLDARQVRDILIRTATPSPDPTVSRIVNAREAVAAALIGSGVEPLTVEIIGPEDGERISAGSVSASLVARTSSLYDTSPRVLWRSNIEGELAIGSGSAHIFERTGPQTLTVEVEDSHGNRVSDAVTVVIVNDPPIVWIDTPVEGQRFRRNDAIVLSGHARDPNDLGAVEADGLQWALGDGRRLGTGNTLTLARNTLPIGENTIRLQATDGELEGSAAVRVTIEAPTDDDPPSVRILNPPSGFSAFVDQRDPTDGRFFLAVDLRGEATDPEDGALQANSLRWTIVGPDGRGRVAGHGRSLQVPLYALQPFSTPYRVVLEATDSAGQTRRAGVRVTVQILS